VGRVRTTFPRGHTIPTGAVLALSVGLGHMAPTYLRRYPDHRPTAFAPALFLVGSISGMHIATAARKDALRREALRRRGAVGSDVRDAFATRLVEQGLAIAQRAGARVVSVFWPIRDEPDTLPLIESARRAWLSRPPCRHCRAGGAARFSPMAPRRSDHSRRHEIPEPLASAKALDPDLLLSACLFRPARASHRLWRRPLRSDAGAAARRRIDDRRRHRL